MTAATKEKRFQWNNSPGILSPKIGQPVTNFNRRFLMPFGPGTCPLQHIKSLLKSEQGEVTKNRVFRILYNAAWKQGYLYYLLCRLSSMPHAAWASRERNSLSCFPVR